MKKLKIILLLVLSVSIAQSLYSWNPFSCCRHPREEESAEVGPEIGAGHVDVDLVFADVDPNPNAELFKAIQLNNYDHVVAALKAHANPNAINAEGLTPLQHAALSPVKMSLMSALLSKMRAGITGESLFNHNHDKIMRALFDAETRDTCPHCQTSFTRTNPPEFLLGCTQEHGHSRVLKNLACIMCRDCMKQLETRFKEQMSVSCPNCAQEIPLSLVHATLQSSVGQRRDSISRMRS